MKIKSLKIKTPNLKKITDFYSNILELPCTLKTDESASITIGNSTLDFVLDENALPYHFAINIPCNKEHEALKWLKSRVEILTYENNQIQDFDFWNAKAVYFYDPDQNIVEFIARKNINNSSERPFNSNQLLEISEIGMPVNDIEPIYNKLISETEIEMYDGGIERFCALGGEHGLFICVNYNRKKWFPKDDPAHPSPFEVHVEIKGNDFNIIYNQEHLQVIPSPQ